MSAEQPRPDPALEQSILDDVADRARKIAPCPEEVDATVTAAVAIERDHLDDTAAAVQSIAALKRAQAQQR